MNVDCDGVDVQSDSGNHCHPSQCDRHQHPHCKKRFLPVSVSVLAMTRNMPALLSGFRLRFNRFVKSMPWLAVPFRDNSIIFERSLAANLGKLLAWVKALIHPDSVLARAGIEVGWHGWAHTQDHINPKPTQTAAPKSKP